MSRRREPFGIPTWYAGVRFRSRLEATWARFFDALCWQWSYEPIELRGYVPDFILGFADPLLVEVKPILCQADYDAHDDTREKIAKSGWQGESLLLGAILGLEGSSETPRIGWLDGGDGNWDDAYAFDCGQCTQASLVHVASSWTCRASGHPIASPHDIVADTNIREAFRHAQNRTQWQPR